MSRPTFAVDARLVGGSSTGDSTYWTCLVEAMSRLDSDFQLLLFSNAPGPTSIPDNSKIKWVHLPARSNRWWSLVAFPLAARRAGAQVIHTQYSLSPLSGPNGITTIHDVSFFVDPSWFKPRDRFLLRSTVPSSAKRAKAVITVSNTSKGEIERYIPAAKGKVTAIYNAAPPWITSVNRDDAKETVRHHFGIEKPYFLTVGARWPRKNVSLAIEAYRSSSLVADYDLVLTGKYGWGDEGGGPGIKAIGYVDQSHLSALFTAADLFLLPSRHEGFGIPMLESWRCGTPVLCSSGGALPEIAGDAAYVEPSWEKADWARSIQDILNDTGKLKLMQERGRQRERQFTWDQAARETLALYQEVAR